jgi:DNA-binding NtrC family response regulator
MERFRDDTPAAAKTAIPGPGGGGGFVLLIGEDEGVRDSLAALLQAHGYGVLAAGRAEDLPLSSTGGGGPLCVVLDPDREDVPEAAVITETKQRFPDLPVIAITHGLSPAEREGAPLRGVEQLRKPLKPERLLSRLAALRKARAGGFGISPKDHSG